MSPALLDSRAPAHALYGHHDDGHALQKPNPNGQISTLFSLNFSGLFEEHQSENMNSSNANAGPSGLQNSSEINSDIGWNTPGMGSRKPEIGSASGRSNPRMAKLRRHAGSHHTRSSLASETDNIDPGFNPFRRISNNSIPSSSGAEMGSSVSGNLNLGNVGNEAFVFGASPENSNSNLISKVGNSSGFVENKILDDMRKLKIGSEKQFVNISNLVLKVNESDRETSSHAEGSNKGVSVSDSVKKKGGIYESAVSTLPDEMRKLNNEGSRNVDSSKNANDVSSNLSANDKTHFSFRSDNVTNSFGRSMASELPNELKKLNSKDAGEVDGSSLNYNADDMKTSVVGNINKGSDFLAGRSASILPDKVKNFDIKECVNTYSGEKEEANFSAADKSGFVFGSTGGASGSLDGRAENLLSDKMGKFKIGGEGMGTSSWDEIGTPHVELGTTNPKGNIFSGLHKKLEFSAKKESAKDARSKKNRGKLKKPTPVARWLGQDFVLRESTSQEHLDSFESYSPMDVSPYQETLADNKGSRETSVTSEEAFHLDNNNASSEPCPTFSNDATDEDLVVAAQCFDMNECDVKCTETKVEGSQYRFGASVGAEGPSEESFSGAETESFKSLSELLDSSTDTFVTVANTGVSSSSRIERQDSDDRMHFSSSSVSEDVGGTDFMFAASSSAHGQSSAATRHHKKKNRVKVVHESYSLTQTKVSHTSSTMQFFPISETSSLLSPRRGQKGVLPTLFNRKGDSSEAVKEPETKQEKLSTPAASIGAQEVCEKWRLRGNQAYANGDMSRAEDYYTQGVNCVSQNENSRSCLRALMLCYSNRAATRMSQGRMREALADCMKAAAIDPSFLRVLVRAANCYLALGELEDASLHFMKCLQSGSDVCVDRKLVLEASEGLEKAQKVSECMKQSAELLQRRTSSDAETAWSVIAEALTISSYCEKLLQMKGDALFMLRKYEELIRFCEQSLGSAEMNCSVISADAHLTNLDCSDVEKNLSFRLWRWRLIIKSYFYLGKLEEALDFLKRQEESVSTTEKSASKTLESLIPLAGTILELICHKAAGNEAFQSRRHAEAVEHYTAAISCTVESRPFAAVCFWNRAAAYKAMGQIIDAIADCSLAIALDGNCLKAISRRATLFEMIRDYEQAAVDLQRLVSLLVKQVEDEANLSGASDRMSSVNELRQSQQRLSVMEEDARKEIPLNMYLILGVGPSVTASEIKKAYRKAALRHHPDKAGQSLARSENGDDGLWKEVVEEVHKDADRLFKMIGEAYAVLSNPTKRSRYDLDEEMRNAQKRGNGGNSSRMPTDVQNYPFEKSGSRRQWQEVWRSYGNS